MIGSDLDGADLQSRVASWAASAASDDAAAVRAVIEVLWRPADGGRCGRRRQPLHRQRRRHAARARNVVGSQQLTVTYDATFENVRLGFTFRFDDIAVKGDLGAVRATSQGYDHDPRCRHTRPARLRRLFVLERTRPLEDHAVHVPAVAGAVRRGLLRHLASPLLGFGHVPHPLAVAQHDAVPAVTLIYLPYRGRAGRSRRGGRCRGRGRCEFSPRSSRRFGRCRAGLRDSLRADRTAVYRRGAG